MLSKEELQQIIDGHDWIKVKKFNLLSYVDAFKEEPGYSEALDAFEEHHKEETEFLIDKCRELAKELLKREDNGERSVENTVTK